MTNTKRRSPRSMKGSSPYPEPFSHLPRVQGVAYRADRDQWRVRLYSGTKDVIFDGHFRTYDEAVAAKGVALFEREAQERLFDAFLHNPKARPVVGTPHGQPQQTSEARRDKG